MINLIRKVSLAHLCLGALVLGCLVAGGYAVVARTSEHYGPSPDGFGTIAGSLPVQSAIGTPVEVTDFFYYGCPHCNAFEPALESWVALEGSRIHFRRVPVGLSDELKRQGALYYTLEQMGALPTLHGEVFRAIHVGGNPLDTDAGILAWARSKGLPANQFASVYRSAEVANAFAAGQRLLESTQVDGVPAVVIGGRWVVSPVTAGSVPRALSVMSGRVDAALQQGSPKVPDSHPGIRPPA